MEFDEDDSGDIGMCFKLMFHLCLQLLLYLAKTLNFSFHTYEPGRVHGTNV